MPSIVSSPQQPARSKTHHHALPPYLRDCERYLGRTVGVCFHVLFFILIVRFFIIDPGINDGISMVPTIKNHTFFITEKITPLFIPLKRFDVIQFFDPKDKANVLVKRIVGMPGETIIFQNNAVYIKDKTGNVKKFDESYINQGIVNDVPYGEQREFTVPANSYFVLGDNRYYSIDSRAFGFVPRTLIIGEVYPIAQS